jgi:hypothetical protein
MQNVLAAGVKHRFSIFVNRIFIFVQRLDAWMVLKMVVSIISIRVSPEYPIFLV